MNKKTDKLIDALGSLDEHTLASCLSDARNRRVIWERRRARVALLLAASLTLALLASALIIAPMMKRDTPDIPTGTDTGTTQPSTNTNPESDFEWTPTPPLYTPGGFQLLSVGSVSYSGFTVDDKGIITPPSDNKDITFDETSETFTAPMPIIMFSCGRDYTVKLTCDDGIVGKVALTRDGNDSYYQYVDDNGGRLSLFQMRTSADNEVTVRGDDTVMWHYFEMGSYNDTDCNRDTFIDYTVYDRNGNEVAAGCIYVAAFRYLDLPDLLSMTHKGYNVALSNFEVYETQAAQYTLRKAIHLYGESFMGEDGKLDEQKRADFYAYHSTVQSIRSTVPAAEWIDTALFADMSDGYNISHLARTLGESFANPYAPFDIGVDSVPTEEVLATFDETQQAYYEDFLGRMQKARTEAEAAFTAYDRALVGLAKLLNDKFHLNFEGGMSMGCMIRSAEHVIFEVHKYGGNFNSTAHWLVIGDAYYEVTGTETVMHEGEDYHFTEHYTLADGTIVDFYFSDTLEDKVEFRKP